MINVEHYKTLVFDCDGVVLDSNKVKSEAFYKAAWPYGKEAAEKLLEYHKNNGGVSRYKKFRYFLDNIAKKELTDYGYEALLTTYASAVINGMLTCKVAENLIQLREKTKDTKWLIVSGGDQEELRDIFKNKGLDTLFDAGIFGSPDTKETILEREITHKNIIFPALFLGDSKYDYEAARYSDLDFVFVSSWTEVLRWKQWVTKENIPAIKSIGLL